MQDCLAKKRSWTWLSFSPNTTRFHLAAHCVSLLNIDMCTYLTDYVVTWMFYRLPLCGCVGGWRDCRVITLQSCKILLHSIINLLSSVPIWWLKLLDVSLKTGLPDCIAFVWLDEIHPPNRWAMSAVFLKLLLCVDSVSTQCAVKTPDKDKDLERGIVAGSGFCFCFF